MDLSKKAGSVDVNLYQYDECAVAFLGVYGGILCGVLVLTTFVLLFSIRVLLHHAVLSPVLYFLSPKPPHVSLKNCFVILSFRSTRCLIHVRGAELLPSSLFFGMFTRGSCACTMPVLGNDGNWKWLRHIAKNNESERDSKIVPS